MYPAFPIFFRCYSIQALCIIFTIDFKIFTDIKHGRIQSAFGPEQQRNQNSPGSAVSIHKRMNYFKLSVHDRCLDQWFLIIKIHVRNKIFNKIRYVSGRRRNKYSIIYGAVSCANPNLFLTNFSRLFVLSTNTFQQRFLNFTNQCLIDRLSFFKPFFCITHRCTIIENFNNISVSISGKYIGIKAQYIIKCSPCSFNFR